MWVFAVFAISEAQQFGVANTGDDELSPRVILMHRMLRFRYAEGAG